MSQFKDDDSAQRITAGIPALDAAKRARLSYKERQRAKVRAVVAEAEGKEAAATAPDAGRPRTRRAAAGLWLQPNEFLRRLTKLTSRLHFEVSKASQDRLGIYLPTSDPEHPLRYLAAFDYTKPIPEFSLLRKSVGRVEVMGWRTILLRLMSGGVLTKAQVETTFGPPSKDSRLWQAQTT